MQIIKMDILHINQLNNYTPTDFFFLEVVGVRELINARAYLGFAKNIMQTGNVYYLLLL